ncbi:MAG TPA: glycoside hydrolase family 127 protein [Thermoguttaceae bacterium]|nr:glycoside hydrolase family 127 protein [Thermoguttaceae bacterium]
MADAKDRGVKSTPSAPHVKLRSVDPDDVRWTQGFWAAKQRLCREAMIPTVEEALHDPQNGACLDNFRVAAGVAEGGHVACHWSDGDCYKFIEALSHVYAVTRDEKLDRLLDHWIEIIGKAQDDDGYLSTNVQLDPNVNRWQRLHHHELYNFGHLLTAACVHHRTTGKDNFLRIAKKAGDYLYSVFQPRPRELARFGFNPSNIMGAAELYRTTGDPKYLELARVFVDMRGSAPATPEERADPRHLGGTDCTQDRVPLRRETEAVGHCVCATYLYCGAADVCAETGDPALREALEHIWRNVTTRRMYVTGAVGSFRNGTSSRGDFVHEAFGRDYELPSRTAYCETCSNIGGAMWSRRMLGLTGEAKYADLMELVLYNSMLSAVAADGKGFFYANPLKWDDRTEGLSHHHTPVRWATHGCFCCPPQVIRTIAKLHGWAYGASKEGVWVHLYGGNELRTELPHGTAVRLAQETDYPWDGRVRITVHEAPSTELALMLRIPGWAEQASVTVNGGATDVAITPGTYARLRRTWSAGDVIELDLPMPVRLIEAHPDVEDARGKVAVKRGPVVYCAEFPLQENGERIWREGVFLPENVRLAPTYREGFLGGVVVLEGEALTFRGRDRFQKQAAGVPIPDDQRDWADRLYRPIEPRHLPKPGGGTVDITLIPYYAWANRGESYMEVWSPLAR